MQSYEKRLIYESGVRFFYINFIFYSSISESDLKKPLKKLLADSIGAYPKNLILRLRFLRMEPPVVCTNPTCDEHDQTVAYSLSIPFVSTFAFAAVMKHQDAPGTTFKRHMQIAKGVLNEDDYLLQEILFNPYTSGQVSQIREELAELIDIIDHKDAKRMKLFLTKIRNHVREDIEIKEH